MTTTDTYFETLAAQLRENGVPARKIAATLDELRSYVAESGSDPEDEFGPAGEFAAQFTVSAEPEAPDTETWRWTTDAFTDVEKLNEFGDQGWELERVDKAGMFVSRRDVNAPQRWEYRREMTGIRRARVVAQLAPEGWEPCGTWMYTYFKRPKAASLGPAARVTDPAARPDRRFQTSRTGMLLAVVVPVALLVCVSVVNRLPISSFAASMIDLAILVPTSAAMGVVYAKSKKKS